MFRHAAESIKENSSKRFISKIEKDKFNNYETILRLKEDSYTKEETDSLIKEISDITYSEVTDTYITERNTVPGIITDIEIFGNTKQKTETINIVPEVSIGAISGTTGENADRDDRRRSDFISVKYGDKISVNASKNRIYINIFFYDKSKKFISASGTDKEVTVPNTEVAYIRFYSGIYPDYTVVVNRTYLEDIRSVGEPIGDGTYKLTLKSCGKNLFDGEFEKGFYDISTGEPNSGVPNIRSVNFIHVHGNTTYKITKGYDYPGDIWILQYDINKKFIGNIYCNTGQVTTSCNTTYIKFYIVNTSLSLDTPFQIEEDIKTTSYEPHQYSECNIILPCQLDKLGNISDRLFRREDGVWCIEKNIKNVKIDGSDNEKYGYWSQFINNEYFSWYINVESSFNLPQYPEFAFVNLNDTVCDKYLLGDAVNIDTNMECFRIRNANPNYIAFRFSRSKISLDINESSNKFTPKIRKYLSENPMTVKFIQPPEIIELPLDVQITLNSFYSTTHIYDNNTDIAPTIKCKIPKSLSSSIDSLVLKSKEISDRVTDIESIKEGQCIEHSSDTGYKIFSDNNDGQVYDLKIEGKSIVNLANVGFREKVFKLSEGEHYNDIPIIETSLLKPDTTYTLFYNVKLISNSTSGILNGGNMYSNIGVGNHTTQVHPTNNVSSSAQKISSHTKIIFNYSDFGSYRYFRLRPLLPPVRPIPAGQSIEYVISNIILLEGDHIDRPVSFFEGIKSVEDIKLITRDENANILDLSNEIEPYLTTEYLIDKSSGTVTVKSVTDNEWALVKIPLNIIPNTEYTISTDNIHKTNFSRFYICDDFNNVLCDVYNPTSGGIYTIKPTQSNKILLHLYANDSKYTSGTTIYEGVRIEKQQNQFKQYNDHSKELFITSTGEKPILRGLPNGVCDTIEKHSDGKYYLHKRCDEVEVKLLNFDYWDLATEGDVTTNGIAIYTTYTDVLYRSDLVSTVLKGMQRETVTSESYDFVTINNNTIVINIARDRLDVADKAHAVQWLANNPISLVYQKKYEEIYEVNNLDLESFEGETSLIVDSGVISPKISFKLSTYVGNYVKIVNDRVKALEDGFTRMMISQNILQLNSTYSSDRLAYNLDIITYSNMSSTDTDEKLFKLILDILISGKNNYNESKMENIIDFYTIIGKLDYEMADLLFSIIYEEEIIDNVNVGASTLEEPVIL